MCSTDDYQTEYQFQLTTGFCQPPPPPQGHNTSRETTLKKVEKLPLVFRARKISPESLNSPLTLYWPELDHIYQNKSLAREMRLLWLAQPSQDLSSRARDWVISP